MGLVAIEAACTSYGKLRVRNDRTHLQRSIFMFSLFGHLHLESDYTGVDVFSYLLPIPTHVKHRQDAFYVPTYRISQPECLPRSLLADNGNVYTITDRNPMYIE